MEAVAVMLGSNVVVLSIEDARALDKALHDGWGRAKLERFSYLGVLKQVSDLRDVVRDYDRKEES